MSDARRPTRHNLFRPEYALDEERPPGFRSRRALIGHELGTGRVGLSQFELPPGETAYPYHWHLYDEELVVVLAGRPTLRAPEGEVRLEAGDIVHFPIGEEGAHQLRNDTDEVISFLSISSKGAYADVVTYLDAGKIGIAERRPDGSGLRLFFEVDAAVGYWHGEPERGDGRMSAALVRCRRVQRSMPWWGSWRLCWASRARRWITALSCCQDARSPRSSGRGPRASV